MKIVIGIVGEKGGGKETFAVLLQEYLPDKKMLRVSFSDILGETLKLWDLPQTRANLQQLAISMNQGYGLGTLTRAVSARISGSDADVVLLDGVRWLSDADMIRSFPDHILVYVTAGVKVRYERTRARKAKVGEAGATYEQFVAEENVLTELDIVKIGKTAEFKVNNDGSLEDLKKHVHDFAEKSGLVHQSALAIF